MQKTIGRLMIAAATLLAAQLSIGCGDSDSDTASQGNGGSGGSTNNDGKNGGNNGGGDSFGGPPATACMDAETQQCQELRGSLEAFFEEANEACVEDGGEIVDSCPKGDLVGTCTAVVSGVEAIVYFYGDEHDPAELKRACEMQGIWKDG